MISFKWNKLWWLSGLIALVIILILVGGSFYSLLAFNKNELNFIALFNDKYILHVFWFSIYQAALSTLLSLIISIPLARAFSRRTFMGKRFILKLLNISIALPVIIAVFGIVAIHGQSGWIVQIFKCFGIEIGSYLYGLTGILLAHLFFNVPLATKLILQTIESIPSSSWRLASQLDFKSKHIFLLLEWPKIKQQLPSLSALIFILCFTSFAIVLTLGGTPKFATMEVAIYQALKFNFDINQAVGLSLIQITMTVIFMALSSIFLKTLPINPPCTTKHLRCDQKCIFNKFIDIFVLTIAFCLMLPPLMAILVSGLNSSTLEVLLSPKLYKATVLSLQIAFSSALLSLCLSCAILFSTRVLRSDKRYVKLAYFIENIGSIILVIPSIVMGTGLFLLCRKFTDIFAIAPLLVVTVNALISLPFLIRILEAPINNSFSSYNKLAISLGLSRLERLRLVEFPLLRKPIGFALGLSAVLSLGDLSAIALFGSQDFTTLPLMLYQQIGSYQIESAGVTAIFMLFLCGFIFYLFEHLIGGKNA